MKPLSHLAVLLCFCLYACSVHISNCPVEPLQDEQEAPLYKGSSPEEKASPEPSLNAYSKADVECMAEAIYFEARGEPVAGQTAVGLVILRRTQESRYPNDVCGVVRQNEHRFGACQFSYRCDGKTEAIRKENNASYNLAVSVAQCVLDGGCKMLAISQATMYYACSGPNAVQPDWDFNKLRPMGKLGHHCFMLEV